MKINSNVGILVFAYNRPWHTQQTIEALQKNELASESDLIIYSDEAKTENEQENVDKVRLHINKINKFRKVTIIKREKNWGLANNIIDGVTKVVDQYGKIIVIEDDIVTSPYFLKYMNEALDYYKDKNYFDESLLKVVLTSSSESAFQNCFRKISVRLPSKKLATLLVRIRYQLATESESNNTSTLIPTPSIWLRKLE